LPVRASAEADEAEQMSFMGFSPLLAAFGDVVASIAAVVVPIFLVARAIWAARKPKDAPPLGGPPRQAPRRVAPQQPPAQPAQQKKLTDEVEEFLRRAAERRRGGQPHEVEILRPEAQAPPQRTATLPSQLAPPRMAELVDPTDEERIGRESVERHTQQHLDTTSYSSRAEQLTTVDDADENMQSHLHSVFDHQMGSLGQPTRSTTADDALVAPAAEVVTLLGAPIAEMLASPQGLRNAFVLQEILRRPEDRW